MTSRAAVLGHISVAVVYIAIAALVAGAAAPSDPASLAPMRPTQRMSSVAAAPGLPPMSLMIQVSTTAVRAAADPAVLQQLGATLETIRTTHRDPQGGGFIQNLVLTDIDSITSPASLATSVLDVLAPYLPGGSRQAFDNVFVGTVGSPSCQFTAGIPAVVNGCARSATWSPYVEGISSPAVTNWSVAVSASLAKAFVQRYPRIRVNWYVSWEAFLPTLMRDDAIRTLTAAAIRQSYLSYLIRLSAALGQIAGGRAFLWSPALDQPIAQLRVDGQLAAFETNFAAFFAKLRSAMSNNPVTASSAFWLDVQDGLSRPCLLIGGAYNNTIATRVEWYRLLIAFRSAWMPEIQINAELFTSPSCPEYGTASAVQTRLSSYAAAGVAVGPSFDLASWAAVVASG